MAKAIGHNSRVFEVNTTLQKTCRSVLCIVATKKQTHTISQKTNMYYYIEYLYTCSIASIYEHDEYLLYS